MAHGGIYVPTLLELTYKAGLNVNPLAVAEAFANSYIAQAEGLINSTARTVFAVDTAAFTALPAGGKILLTQIASDLAAIYAIQYDMSGFSSRNEAEDMLAMLRDSAMRGLSLLRDQKTVLFITQGS